MIKGLSLIQFFSLFFLIDTASAVQHFRQTRLNFPPRQQPPARHEYDYQDVSSCNVS